MDATVFVPEMPSEQPEPDGRWVSLRPLKALASKMGPRNPLRNLLLTEPDEIPWEEYAAKASIWFKLLSLRED